MLSNSEEAPWDFSPAIALLNAPPLPRLSAQADSGSTRHDEPVGHHRSSSSEQNTNLGDFGALWDYLGRPRLVQEVTSRRDEDGTNTRVAELDAGHLNRLVRWRDELEGADLEDNVEAAPEPSAASLRTQKRAERRARAKDRSEKLAAQHRGVSDTNTDRESDEELESLRRSPDRRAVIADIVGRPTPAKRDASSPPTSPSPPKSDIRHPKKDYAKSNPFLTPHLWHPPSHRTQIIPQDGLSPTQRKALLISSLIKRHPSEKQYLLNAGLLQPAFTPLNVSTIGVHVFVDISNIMIGFHDCLKLLHQITLETPVRRVPMCFHNFSLVLERGRPAAKRVLAGSDKFPVIQQAQKVGYETNILERVHKAKELTPRQKRFRSAGGASSGVETSGSDTNGRSAPEKWVEQAVDEILHLKILESLVDADKPSTMVLATGDAAEAEYSGGFMRMVERALEKGWMVELVSFRLNTSSAYKRWEFRTKWGAMFKWIQLDEYAEQLMDEEE